MKVETAFLAQAAEVSGDGRIFVYGGGIEGLITPTVPLVVPQISIVVRLHFLLGECGTSHNLRITMSDSDGEDCGLDATVSVNPVVPEYMPDRGTRLFATFGVNYLKFDQFGVYAVNVFVGDERLDGFTIGVHQAKPPEEEGN